VLEALPSERRRDHHQRLALTLEATGETPPELLARHFHGAGMTSRAADYAVAAADTASASLAFVRAAELYRLARTWDPRDAAWTRVLLAREADALANAGHFAGSASAFMAAAAEGVGADGLELRRRACEQLLAGGQLDEGMTALASLLKELDLPQPGGPMRTMLEVAGRVVGFALQTRRAAPAARIDASELLRIDTCYAAAKVLVDADPIRGVYFSVQALRRALVGGDAERIARGLCLVGGSVTASGDAVFSRIGDTLMRRGRAMAGAAPSDHLLGTMAVAEGQVFMLRGRWREALERSEDGVRRLERCRDSAGERMVGHFAILRALEDLGAHRRLIERASTVLQAASAVGNRYAVVYALHQLVLSRLAAGDLPNARVSASRSAAEWTKTGVHIQHLYRLRAEAHCDLWEGRAEAALARLDAELAPMEASHLLRFALVRVDVRFLRARILLAVAAAEPSQARRLIRRAAADARRLARERRPDGDAHAALVRAGAASLGGDGAGALRSLERAEAAYRTAGMAAYAACALRRRGELLPDADGRPLRERADAELAACGVDAVAPWVALCAPGFVRSAQREAGLEREVRFGAERAIPVVHDLDQHGALEARRPE